MGVQFCSNVKVGVPIAKPHREHIPIFEWWVGCGSK